MVTISCLKSLIVWISTWVNNDWVTGDSRTDAFMTVAAANTAAYLTIICVLFEGKVIQN